MNTSSILFILPILVVTGFALYQYFYYKKGKERVYQLFSPIFLMLAALGICVLIFMLLFSLGLVK